MNNTGTINKIEKGLNNMNGLKNRDENEFTLDDMFSYCKKIDFDFKNNKNLNRQVFLNHVFDAARKFDNLERASNVLYDAMDILDVWNEFVVACRQTEETLDNIECEEILNEDAFNDNPMLFRMNELLAFNSIRGTKLIFPFVKRKESEFRINDNYLVKVLSEDKIEVVENNSNKVVALLSYEKNSRHWSLELNCTKFSFTDKVNYNDNNELSKALEKHLKYKGVYDNVGFVIRETYKSAFNEKNFSESYGGIEMHNFSDFQCSEIHYDDLYVDTILNLDLIETISLGLMILFSDSVKL